MALFGIKTKAKTKVGRDMAAHIAAENIAASSTRGTSLAHILRNPRITEKATMHQMQSVYVFDVARDANKKQIAAAVQAVYSVKPRKVAIVNTKPKIVRNMRTGKRGMAGGGKKAYVYLHKGESITIS